MSLGSSLANYSLLLRAVGRERQRFAANLQLASLTLFTGKSGPRNRADGIGYSRRSGIRRSKRAARARHAPPPPPRRRRSKVQLVDDNYGSMETRRIREIYLASVRASNSNVVSGLRSIGREKIPPRGVTGEFREHEVRLSASIARG